LCKGFGELLRKPKGWEKSVSFQKLKKGGERGKRKALTKLQGAQDRIRLVAYTTGEKKKKKV